MESLSEQRSKSISLFDGTPAPYRVLIVSVLLLLSACSESDDEAAFDRLQAQPLPLSIESTAALSSREPLRPLLEIRPKELLTPIVTLGRQLFHDTRLSGDGTLTCASCHGIDQGGDDNRSTSTGIRGQIGPINSPTVLNSGYNFRQFWDGRAATLDDQARGPVAAGIEMGADWDTVVRTLSEDKALGVQFKAAFGSAEITQDKVVHAIARFEETLTTPSPFDRYLSGELHAISSEAAAGYARFKDYGCSACHQGINVGGNLYQHFGAVQNIDIESFNVAGAEPVIRPREEDVTMVKVPSLRNIELTAPYFHAGKINDLHTAVRVMGLSQIGKVIPNEDVEQIVAFLKSLTGNWQQHAALIE